MSCPVCGGGVSVATSWWAAANCHRSAGQPGNLDLRTLVSEAKTATQKTMVSE